MKKMVRTIHKETTKVWDTLLYIKMSPDQARKKKEWVLRSVGISKTASYNRIYNSFTWFPGQ